MQPSREQQAQGLILEPGLPLQQLIRLRTVAGMLEYEPDSKNRAAESVIFDPFRPQPDSSLAHIKAQASPPKSSVPNTASNRKSRASYYTTGADPSVYASDQYSPASFPPEDDHTEESESDADAESISSDEAISEWGLESLVSELHMSKKDAKKRKAQRSKRRESRTGSIATTLRHSPHVPSHSSHSHSHSNSNDHVPFPSSASDAPPQRPTPKKRTTAVSSSSVLNRPRAAYALSLSEDLPQEHERRPRSLVSEPALRPSRHHQSTDSENQSFFDAIRGDPDKTPPARRAISHSLDPPKPAFLDKSYVGPSHKRASSASSDYNPSRKSISDSFFTIRPPSDESDSESQGTFSYRKRHSRRDSQGTVMTARTNATSVLNRPRPRFGTVEEDQDEENEEYEEEGEESSQPFDVMSIAQTLTYEPPRQVSKTIDHFPLSEPGYTGYNEYNRRFSSQTGYTDFYNPNVLEYNKDTAQTLSISENDLLSPNDPYPISRSASPDFELSPLNLAVPLDQDPRMAEWTMEERKDWAVREQICPMPRFPFAARPPMLIMPAPLQYERMEQERLEEERRIQAELEEQERVAASKPLRAAGKLYGTSLMDTLLAKKEFQKNRKRMFTGDNRRAMHQLDVQAAENQGLTNDKEPFHRYSKAFTAAQLNQQQHQGGQSSGHLSQMNQDQSIFGLDRVMQKEMIKLQKILELEEIQRQEDEKKEQAEAKERERKEAIQAAKEAKKKEKLERKRIAKLQNEELAKRHMSDGGVAVGPDGKKLKRKSHLSMAEMDKLMANGEVIREDENAVQEWPPPLAAFNTNVEEPPEEAEVPISPNENSHPPDDGDIPRRLRASAAPKLNLEFEERRISRMRIKDDDEDEDEDEEGDRKHKSKKRPETGHFGRPKTTWFGESDDENEDDDESSASSSSDEGHSPKRLVLGDIDIGPKLGDGDDSESDDDDDDIPITMIKRPNNDDDIPIAAMARRKAKASNTSSGITVGKKKPLQKLKPTNLPHVLDTDIGMSTSPLLDKFAKKEKSKGSDSDTDSDTSSDEHAPRPISSLSRPFKKGAEPAKGDNDADNVEEDDDDDDIPFAKRLTMLGKSIPSKKEPEDEEGDDVPIGKRITTLRAEDDIPLGLKGASRNTAANDDDAPLGLKAGGGMVPNDDDMPLGIQQNQMNPDTLSMAMQQQQEHMFMLSMQQDAAIFAQGMMQPNPMMMGMQPPPFMPGVPGVVPGMEMMSPPMVDMNGMPMMDMNSMMMMMNNNPAMMNNGIGVTDNVVEDPGPIAMDPDDVPLGQKVAAVDPSVVAGGIAYPPAPVVHEKLVSSIDKWRRNVTADEVPE